MAGFEFPLPESVIGLMAAFDGPWRPQSPGRRSAIPATRRYSPAVSRRTPVACSMRRKDHPSRPSAMTCSRFSLLKTLLMTTEATCLCSGYVLSHLSMAGFNPITEGTPRLLLLASARPKSGFHIAYRPPRRPMRPTEVEHSAVHSSDNLEAGGIQTACSICKFGTGCCFPAAAISPESTAEPIYQHQIQAR